MRASRWGFAFARRVGCGPSVKRTDVVCRAAAAHAVVPKSSAVGAAHPDCAVSARKVAAAVAPAVPLALTIEEARQQARAEGLTLLEADNKTGYYGV